MLNLGSSPATFYSSSLRVAYLPFLLPTVTGLGVVLAYVIAVCNDHILPVFPYISNLGAAPPESCILSTVLNISSFLWLVIAYIQFLRTGHLLLNRSAIFVRPAFQRAIHMLNLLSVVIGIFIAIMLNITANFPWHITPLVHMISTIGGFFLSVLYTWVFAAITLLFAMDHVLRLWLVIFRILLVVVESACFVLVLVLGFLARSQFGTYDPSETRYTVRWGNENAGGFAFYVTTTSLEWVMVGCVMLFIASFSIELYGCRLTYPSMHDTNVNVNRRGSTRASCGVDGSLISGHGPTLTNTVAMQRLLRPNSFSGGFVHIVTNNSNSNETPGVRYNNVSGSGSGGSLRRIASGESTTNPIPTYDLTNTTDDAAPERRNLLYEFKTSGEAANGGSQSSSSGFPPISNTGAGSFYGDSDDSDDLDLKPHLEGYVDAGTTGRRSSVERRKTKSPS